MVIDVQELSISTDASLLQVWDRYERLAERLTRYLAASELEFCGLIEALDACWNVAETVQAATVRLSAHAGGSGEARALRDSLLDGCCTFQQFLERLQQIALRLTMTARETRRLLRISNHLESELVPLKYIAFYFLLEASRLGDSDKTLVLKMHEEIRDVVRHMQSSSDTQQETVAEILTKLALATDAVDRAAAGFADRAAESRSRIERDVESLLAVPSELAEMHCQAQSLGTAVTAGVREAVKVLQGHDAIRQRLEHVAAAVETVRATGGMEEGMEPGNALLLQRGHTRNILAAIVDVGARIDLELRGVIGAANRIADEGGNDTAGTTKPTQGNEFEEALTRLGGLGAELGELLASEARMGGFMLAQIDPVRGLLRTKSAGMEELAHSMKRLALNVMIGSGNMPEAQGLDVLGVWTSEASERVLGLARDLNERFAILGTELGSQAHGIHEGVAGLGSKRTELTATGAIDGLRDSRKSSYEEVAASRKAVRDLQTKVEELLRSLRFVDEGTELLGELDSIFACLLALYPKPERSLDMDATGAGYTMAEQHQVHAALFGGASLALATKIEYARLGAAASGEDYGANVELF